MERVYLSRRNLQVLLSKLDRKAAGEHTFCMLIKNDTAHRTYPQTMDHIEIVALEDEEYYTDREPGDVLPVDLP
jgi:hypothetical protein